MTHRSFQLPPRFKSSARGACVPAVLTLLGGLHDDDFVIEGYVLSAGLRNDHTWLEVNGLFVDPTIRQFQKLRCWQDSPMHYEESRRIAVWEYRLRARIVDAAFWRKRTSSFGGVFAP